MVRERPVAAVAHDFGINHETASPAAPTIEETLPAQVVTVPAWPISIGQ